MRFTNARLPDARIVDIDIEAGVIASVSPAGSSSSSAQVVDLEHKLVLPAFAEPHAHLDKALLSERIDNPSNDLMGAIHALDDARHSITFDDIVDRGVRAAELFARNGATSIRTHADTMDANGLQSVNALLEVKRRCAGFVDIQVAMLLAWPVVGESGARHRDLAEEAVAAGVDVIGGCPHLDDHPEEALEYFLALAERHKLPLDLHADENLRPDSRDLERLADRMLATRPTVLANASHCVSLGMQPAETQRRTAEKVASAGISVTALPITNLFLQSRDVRVAMPRGITAITSLMEAGVVVAAGADNVQDPFNPMGRADPLETASLMVVAGHVDPDTALRCVGRQAHVAVGQIPPGLNPGDRADFVALNASSPREAVAMQPSNRMVIHRGAVVFGQS